MLRKIQINENKLRQAIRQSLQEGAWGYEPLQSDGALDFRDVIYDDVIQQIVKGLKSGQSGQVYGALGTLIEFMSMILSTSNYSLFCCKKDDCIDPAVAEAFKTIRSDKGWLESWNKPGQIKKEIDQAEKDYQKLKKSFLKKYNLDDTSKHTDKENDQNSSKLINEHDISYEPLNSDSAFDFRSTIIKSVLKQIKERLLSKRGQDVYDAIGVLNDFLEKFAFDRYMDLEGADKSIDDAVRQAFNTARADKDWINSWKDPQMLVTMIDAEEKKYNNFYNINNLQRKLYGKRLKIDETRLRREIRIVSRAIKQVTLNEYHANSVVDDSHIKQMIRSGYLAHGTPSDFDSFDDEFIRGGWRGTYGHGFYFTDEIYKCLEYGANIIFTPKKDYNFLNLDGSGQIKQMVEKIEKLKQERANAEEKQIYSTNNRVYDYYDNIIKNVNQTLRGINLDYLSCFETLINKNPGWSDEEVYKSVLSNLPSGTASQISSLLLNLGFDGVKCGNQYVIFNTNKLNNLIIK